MSAECSHPSCYRGKLNTHLKYSSFLVWRIALMLSLALTVIPEEMSTFHLSQSCRALQQPCSVISKLNPSSMGFIGLKLSWGKQLIPKSLRQIFAGKNQISFLTITEITLGKPGWHYCKETTSGAELLVLGEKQIAGFRNEHTRNSLGLQGLNDAAMLVIMSRLFLLCATATGCSLDSGQCITLKWMVILNL